MPTNRSVIFVLASILTTGCPPFVDTAANVPERLCGPKAPEFEVPPGTSWDPTLYRPTTGGAVAACVNLLDPSEFSDQKASYTLPKADVLGFVKVDLGSIKLDRDYHSRWRQLESKDYLDVETLKMGCIGAFTKYGCVVFSDPNNEPWRVYARSAMKANAEIAAIGREIQRIISDKGTSPAEAKEQVQRALDRLPTEIKADTGSAATPIFSSQRIDTLEEALASHLVETEKDASELRKRVADVEDAIAWLKEAHLAVLEHSVTAECLAALRTERDKVLQNRARVINELNTSGAGVKTATTSAFKPFAFTVGAAGFDVCSVSLDDAMTDKIRSLASALSHSMLDQKGMSIQVLGFSDQTPLLILESDPLSQRCRAFASNRVLARERAEVVRKLLVKELGTLLVNVPRSDAYGRDDDFIKDCSHVAPQDLKACHAENRRFEIRVEGPALVAEPPDKCLPTTVTR